MRFRRFWRCRRVSQQTGAGDIGATATERIKRPVPTGFQAVVQIFQFLIGRRRLMITRIPARAVGTRAPRTGRAGAVTFGLLPTIVIPKLKQPGFRVDRTAVGDGVQDLGFFRGSGARARCRRFCPLTAKTATGL